jgi:hypothetical protein
MKTSRILHLQTLIDKGACRDQVRLFGREFGKSVRVTESLCRRVAPLFHWNWAAQHLLSAPALKAYNEARATALKAYDEARATAGKAYKNACAPLKWSERGSQVIASTRKVYKETIASACKAYEEAAATAFARAYINDQ